MHSSDRHPLLRDSIVVLTRDYPFGTGEPFVEDEVSMLARLGPVVVLPAFAGRRRDRHTRRELPEGVYLDESLVDRSVGFIRYPRVILDLARAAWRELRSQSRIFGSPRSMIRFAGYLYRAGRLLGWVDRVRRAGNAPCRVMAFWSNSEAFGMALAARRFPSIMFVARSHGFDVWEDRNPSSYLPFRHELAHASHRLLPISRVAAEHLIRTLPVDADRIVVAPLGVDPPLVPREWQGRKEVLVVSCSSEDPVKRLPLVAASIKAAAEGDPSRSWKWVHLGEGANRIREVIGDGAGNLGLELPGWLSREEVFRFHRDRQPNCFVNLSSSEGIPVSIMEALSMGIPVVATSAGGTVEIVDDSVGALLPVDVDAMAAGAAIRRVIDEGEHLRTAARLRFSEGWSSKAAIGALRQHVPEFLVAPS